MQFSEVIGQESLKQQLIRDYHQNKISHAQLVVGNPGFGALPLIWAYVQYLFCENKQENDSCGQCASCHKVAQLQHADLHFSFPTVQAVAKTSDELFAEWRDNLLKNPYFTLNQFTATYDDKGRVPIIGVEESQGIIRKLNLKSFEGKYKVMIIWMAQAVNNQASNKLLKIIEEPPENTLFFLIADSADMILPTIISRSRLVKVPRLNAGEIDFFLKNRYHLSDTNAASITSQVDGDLILAEELAGNTEDRDFNREQFIQFMRVCYKKDVNDMLDWAQNMATKGRQTQKQFLDYSLHLIRQSLLKNYTSGELTRVSEKEDEFLKKFAKFITGNNIFDFLKQFSDAYYYIDRNANAKILFTQLTFDTMRYIHFA